MSGLTVLVILAGFSFADADLKLNAHRHWFFHSAVPAVAVLIGAAAWGPRDVAGAAVFCISHGAHLLCDLKIGKGGKRGTYLIYVVKGNRLSVRQTDAWLAGNGLICISLALLLAVGG